MNRERIAVTLICLAAATGCGPTKTPDGSSADRPATTLDAGLPTGAPGDVGMSSELLARIRPAMQAYVDDGRTGCGGSTCMLLEGAGRYAPTGI